ncbi:MAG: hypothetical protein GTN67_01810 [Hydrotalea flava]|uniref:hypothetical protein n=1 Tax=Hydrotalea TaxID=1004300 RepID=UPI001692029B|nr:MULTISPECIES: hypothetical protein [Hydrotalea]MBY0349208.1 hypothetical protein [Hydrotalea flava]NIM34228.1 hypothetical protein [Hydrotalea flava]NIM37052.1 hypothetical protein [Hydrotalea flava]NIN02242.1 hypothetical protein [Hydrotalea flava]NIN13897.1 hypothetical protein [Hydrotalea flava]
MYKIPENQQHVFNAVAYMIEKKLLDMQLQLLAHRHPLKQVSIQYVYFADAQLLSQIHEKLNALYQLLSEFCMAYQIPTQPINFKKELNVKANFLWEDITGARAGSMKGYGITDPELMDDYQQKINAFTDGINEMIHILN